MKKKISNILGAVCMAAFLLAILGCEKADGTLNTAWTLPLLAISGLTGWGHQKMEDKK